MVDLHCHILPGLDDGAPTMEDSLAMAESAIADGITHVVATPHSSDHYHFDFAHVRKLRDELQKLRAANASSQRMVELEQILASIQVVNATDGPSNSVTFGATVTVKDKKGRTETYTVVGVDELDLEPDAVSWISPIGKALLAADMGDWITLEDGRTAKIVKIERKSDT